MNSCFILADTSLMHTKTQNKTKASLTSQPTTKDTLPKEIYSTFHFRPAPVNYAAAFLMEKSTANCRKENTHLSTADIV